VRWQLRAFLFDLNATMLQDIELLLDNSFQAMLLEDMRLS